MSDRCRLCGYTPIQATHCAQCGGSFTMKRIKTVHESVLEDIKCALRIEGTDRSYVDWAKEIRDKYDLVKDLRLEVLNFAQIMEQQLKKNDYKGGWKNLDINYLTKRLYEELIEFSDEIRPAIQDINPNKVGLEGADVANIIMMIVDVCGGLK